MSKHEKHVRRERNKTDRARRLGAQFRSRCPSGTSHIKHGVAVLAAAGAIAAGTSAYAAPIRFDNPAGPGHFVWARPQGDNTGWLDVMEPASAQPAAISDLTSLKHQQTTATESRVRGEGTIPGGAEVEEGGLWGLHLVALNAGDLIPSGASWNVSGFTYFQNYPYLPEGVPFYIGMRFDPGDGIHYGWVGVERSGFDLDPFAWAYETEVGVPIMTPEPGSLALLALGAAAAVRRRRKQRA